MQERKTACSVGSVQELSIHYFISSSEQPCKATSIISISDRRNLKGQLERLSKFDKFLVTDHTTSKRQSRGTNWVF